MPSFRKRNDEITKLRKNAHAALNRVGSSVGEIDALMGDLLEAARLVDDDSSYYEAEGRLDDARGAIDEAYEALQAVVDAIEMMEDTATRR